MKKFIVLARLDAMPEREAVIALARDNPKVKKTWVMEINGNKWHLAMKVITLN